MAIKVNGTTVINDSRSLTNIASVDAATVAALGAAGVGGSADNIEAYATEPAVSAQGGIYYNTSEDQLYISNGTSWRAVIPKPPTSTGGVVSLGAKDGNSAYTYNLTANFDDATYGAAQLSYTLLAGSLPAGLSIVATNITGTVTSIDVAASYSFTIRATNPEGLTADQSYAISVNGYPENSVSGNAVFTSSGTWTVPAGVTNISVVAVGAGGAGEGNYETGGGGGGGLVWANRIKVSAGQSYSITVGQGAAGQNGGDTSVNFGSQGSLTAHGGKKATAGHAGGGFTTTLSNSGGGTGGEGGVGISPQPYHIAGGGGGAAGYSGNGGNGATYVNAMINGTNGSGGGGGGGGEKASSPSCGYTWSSGGGGVGLNGQGANGAGGGHYIEGECTSSGNAPAGGGGSGGASSGPFNYGSNNAGGLYGGGGGNGYPQGGSRGGHGGLRIVWKTGAFGSFGFPSTNVS